MFKKTLVAATLVMVTHTSFAQTYVQGAVGKGDIAFEYADPTGLKRNNIGYKSVVGFTQTNGLTYEGQVIKYGRQTATNSGTSSVIGLGINIASLGNIDSDFGYRLAGGVAMNNASDGSGNQTSQLKLILGGGLSYNISQATAITLEYDISNAALKYPTTVSNSRVSLLSVGIRSRF